MIANLQNVDSPDPTNPDNPNLNLGTADWQVGGIQELPREWGEITLSGYPQTGTYKVTINIDVRCKDEKNQSAGTGCNQYGYNECKTSVSVPINVH